MKTILRLLETHLMHYRYPLSPMPLLRLKVDRPSQSRVRALRDVGQANNEKIAVQDLAALGLLLRRMEVSGAPVLFCGFSITFSRWPVGRWLA